MSKEKPEVGDVWKCEDGCLLHFYKDLDKDCCNVLVYERGELWSCDEFLPNSDCYTYLGKSKVSIKELFDVKD